MSSDRIVVSEFGAPPIRAGGGFYVRHRSTADRVFIQFMAGEGGRAQPRADQRLPAPEALRNAQRQLDRRFCAERRA